MTANPRILQIYYNEATRASLDPGFEPLDNLANERPDWFEYWPIRRYFARNRPRPEEFIGIFSPKFGAKTGLGSAAVREFVRANRQADVILFCPFPDVNALFLNVFEHGEKAHPGLIGLAREFLPQVGMTFDPVSLVMDASNTIYCNFFVAKPAFWKRWLGVLEHCIAHAEDPASPLHARLNEATTHDGRLDPQLKIFLMERMASMILVGGGFQLVAYNPFTGMRPQMCPSPAIPETLRAQLIALDGLKRLYCQSPDPSYHAAFEHLRFLTWQYLSQLHFWTGQLFPPMQPVDTP